MADFRNIARKIRNFFQSSRAAYLLYFIIIIGIGAFFRIYGYDWDNYLTIHPDERQIVSLQIPKIRLPNRPFEPPLSLWLSSLNPKFFAYGTFPLYFLRITSYLYKEYIVGPGKPFHIYKFARILMALFGTLTLYIVYKIGHRAHGTGAGILAALFLCLTVLHIQHSHFYVVEVLQTLLMTIALYYGLRITQQGRGFILFGLFLGLSLATKFSSLSLLAPYTTAILLYHWSRKRIFIGKSWVFFIVAILVALVVCFIAMPFAFFDYGEFFRDLANESRMVRLDPPRFYTFQYVGTPPYWYHIYNLFWHSLGPPLALLSFLGVGYSIYLGFRRKSFIDLYLLSWFLPFFLVTGQFGTKFARYMIPLLPSFAVFAALYVARYRGTLYKALKIFTVIAVLYSLFYSAAYVRIYSKPNTTVMASEWVYENLFEGAHYLIETSAEFNIPVPVPGKGNRRLFAEQNLDLYRQPDNELKARQIADKLEWADYIFISSKRVYGAVFRMPASFPVTCNYYRNLFTENLGFRLIKTFKNPPRLFGWEINEDLADENIRIYDHPKVHIFKKIAQYDSDALYSRIMNPTRSIRNIPMEELLVTDAGDVIPLEKYAVQSEQTILPTGYTFHDINARLAIVIWYVLIQLFGIIAYPVTYLLFKRLPDRGYAFSKLVGIFIFAYLNWIIVSLHLLPNTIVSLAVSLMLLCIFSIYCYGKVKSSMQEFHRGGLRHIFWTEIVFGVVFALFLTFRMYAPDIHWSESSMDISFITSSIRSLHFPPWDVWAAGHRVNYYYFGHYVIAMLTKLSGLPVKFTYNLAISTIPAFAAMLLFSILYNLTRKFRFGIWAVLFGVFSGNLDAFHYAWSAFGLTALKLAREPAGEPAGFFTSTGQSILAGCGHVIQKLIDWGWITMQLFADKDYPRPFRFFRSAHEIIPQTVHEFPFWSLTFVDLHAHLLVMPMYLFVLGLELNLLFRPGTGLKMFGNGITRVIRFILYALFLTIIYPTSTWTYPVHILILLTIFTLRVVHPDAGMQGFAGRSRPFIMRILKRTGSTFFQTFFPLLLLVGTGLLLYMPHIIHFYRPRMGIGLVGNVTTELTDYLTINSFFIFMLLTFLVLLLMRSLNYIPWARGRKQIIIVVALVILVFSISMLSAHVIGNAFNPARNYQVAGFLFPFLLGAMVLLFRSTLSRETRFVLIVAFFFVLIGFGLEIACVKDDYFGGGMSRFNNIFKFYLFAWYLGAVVSAYTIYSIRSGFGSTSRFRTIIRRMWIVVFVLFFLLTLFFIPLGLKHRAMSHRLCHLGTVTPTIDGWACLAQKDPDIYAGIEWLIRNVKYSPVIVEAAGNNGTVRRVDYNYAYSNISAFTGLPTIIGWENHVNQRHYRIGQNEKIGLTQADALARDVKKIYETLEIDVLMKLLNNYNVEYIFVGPLERRVYEVDGLQKFDILTDQFPVVFKQDHVTIYKVNEVNVDVDQQQAFEEYNKRFAERIEARKREQELADAREEERKKLEIEQQMSLPPIYMTQGGDGIRKGMFKEPRGIAADKDGNVYVADFRNSRVQRFDSSGKFQIMWGENGNDKGQFRDLCDVAVDADGNVYVADTFNSRIQKFSSTGRYLLEWSDVDRPRGIDVGPDGLIYVSNTSSGNIRVFNPEGKFLRTLCHKGSGDGELDYPVGIVAHTDGNIYIADARNKRIQVITANGRPVKTISVPGWEGKVFLEPYLTVFPNGNIAVTDPIENRIYYFNPDGKMIDKWNVQGRFNKPMGIVRTNRGEVFVVDCHNHRIQRFKELEQ